MIKKMKDKQIDEVMEIWKESTIKAHDFIKKEYWQDNYDVVKNMYLPAAETFVYEEDSEIKGFISIIDKEFIGALFVGSDFQNQHIGSKLLKHALNEHNKLSLAVYKENKRAFEFYLKNRFTIVKEQINEDSGHDEYIMSRG